MYGGGLRLEECLGLRVKDIDFGRRVLVVRDGKGRKDRETVLAEKPAGPLRRHLEGSIDSMRGISPTAVGRSR